MGFDLFSGFTTVKMVKMTFFFFWSEVNEVRKKSTHQRFFHILWVLSKNYTLYNFFKCIAVRNLTSTFGGVVCDLCAIFKCKIVPTKKKTSVKSDAKSKKEGANRGKQVESQQIDTTRRLYSVQYLLQLSRLQRI